LAGWASFDDSRRCLRQDKPCAVRSFGPASTRPNLKKLSILSITLLDLSRNIADT